MSENTGDEIRTTVKKCSRCGLKYSVKEEECTHCHHIKNSNDLQIFKDQIIASRKESSKTGRVFLLIGLFLALGMFLLS